MIIDSVLFDLDGVLIDTESIYTDFWNSIDRRFPTGVDNFALVIKGSTLESILSRYFNQADHAEILDMLRRQEHDMHYRLFDGVEDLLKALRQRRITTAIVTSSSRAKMEHVFDDIPELAQFTDALITDGDVSHSKPAPDGYLTGAARLGTDPRRCMVVEDSLAGLRAGRAAGAVVTAVATTNPRHKVTPLADFTVDHTCQIARLLAGIG